MRVDIWSDVVCPWCYIGKRRFERALASIEGAGRVQVVHRSFELNSAVPRDRTTDRGEMLKAKYGLSTPELEAVDARLLQTAADEGLNFKLGGQATGNTFDAHRLIQLALDRGRQDAVVERLFRAYFVEGRSIFDAASLTALAEEAGLQAAEVKELLAGDGYADAVLADRRAAASLRVRGVPFFLIEGRVAVSGAQPSTVFREALASARDSQR